MWIKIKDMGLSRAIKLSTAREWVSFSVKLFRTVSAQVEKSHKFHFHEFLHLINF